MERLTSAASVYATYDQARNQGGFLTRGNEASPRKVSPHPWKNVLGIV